MTPIESLPDLNFLSELYSQDAPEARLLAEYPSSNSPDTELQNNDRYIIHDPFPPPRKELLKVLGPHHLMCGWGSRLGVSSQIAPPEFLLEHWVNALGTPAARPDWWPMDNETSYITIFPHESIVSEQQVLDPAISYALHSKEVIEKIDCRQADVLSKVTPPCIVKLSHGYAGLGNFLIRNEADEREMREQLVSHWPGSTVVINSVIQNIEGDFGVQFYLRRNGTVVWLGFTEQQFDEKKKWCGGVYSSRLQIELRDELCGMVSPTAEYLHSCGYFGLVGIDILRDKRNRCFLVDVNPRLTGVSPFLMISRIFDRDRELTEGIYQASVKFKGSMEQLIESAEGTSDAEVVVVSAFEDISQQGEVSTICHLSVSSSCQETNQRVLNRILLT